jgi:SAM-dependent methyltransferase
MASEKEWNVAYKSGNHDNLYPNSFLISEILHFSRKCFIDLSGANVLELGFASGGNIDFIQNLGCKYVGIEQSSIAVELAKARFPNLAQSLHCGDFTFANKLLPVSEKYKIVFDRASITHNSAVNIREILNNIHKMLETDGLFIGIDWFSLAHSELDDVPHATDDYLDHQFKTGYFENLGVVHFTSEAELRELFKNWKLLSLKKVIVSDLVSNPRIKNLATFTIVAQKKG